MTFYCRYIHSLNQAIVRICHSGHHRVCPWVCCSPLIAAGLSAPSPSIAAMMTFMLFLLSPDTFWHLKVVSLKWCCRCSSCCCVDDIGLNYNRIWFTYFCFLLLSSYFEACFAVIYRCCCFTLLAIMAGITLQVCFVFPPPTHFEVFYTKFCFCSFIISFFFSSLFLQTFLLLAKYRSGRVCMCVCVCVYDWVSLLILLFCRWLSIFPSVRPTVYRSCWCCCC